MLKTYAIQVYIKKKHKQKKTIHAIHVECGAT